MKRVLTEDDLDRLEKLLGMLGSAYDGERAAAGAFADKLLREYGLRWKDVLAPKQPEPVPELVVFAINNSDALNDWERNFCRSLKGQKHLSTKQLCKLNDIV